MLETRPALLEELSDSLDPTLDISLSFTLLSSSIFSILFSAKLTLDVKKIAIKNNNMTDKNLKELLVNLISKKSLLFILLINYTPLIKINENKKMKK
ncbi:MAG: hypothetical protein LBM26_01050 [Methanobrevibacter sp.]|nr:hypothetical protein [Methanobrevibacter sp.]